MFISCGRAYYFCYSYSERIALQSDILRFSALLYRRDASSDRVPSGNCARRSRTRLACTEVSTDDTRSSFASQADPARKTLRGRSLRHCRESRVSDAITCDHEVLRHYGVGAESISDYGAWRRLVHPEDIELTEAERDEAIGRGEPFANRLPGRRSVWWRPLDRGDRARDPRRRRPARPHCRGEPGHHRTKAAEAERAKFTEELQRSNEELQRFAYAASHDLQEPLRSIVSFSQLLERRHKGRLGEGADESVGFIVEGGMRMQTLIQDLLQLPRVGTMAAPLVPTDAEGVVAGVAHAMMTPIREGGATVLVEPLPIVMADAAQLAQVFTNLIGNAIECRRPDVPSVVRISTERTGRVWRSSVEDNGIGIEPEYFERIFVIFQRLHTRDEYEGTGIGLAVVRKIVERHVGTVWVDSVPDEGSTFFFTLPAA